MAKTQGGNVVTFVLLLAELGSPECLRIIQKWSQRIPRAKGHNLTSSKAHSQIMNRIYTKLVYIFNFLSVYQTANLWAGFTSVKGPHIIESQTPILIVYIY